MSISPKLALLEEYALVARALSAPARLMILEQLAQGERGVEALAEKTGLTSANCSQHLQQLRRALVGCKARRLHVPFILYVSERFELHLRFLRQKVGKLTLSTGDDHVATAG